MACYVSSNDNRLYVAVESSYGVIGAITDNHRFPAVRLEARQELELPDRRDKMGGRTFVGWPGGFFKRTNYEVTTFLAGWTDQTVEPGYGPLFQGALGSAVQIFNGGTVASIPAAGQLRFTAAHGLSVGQGVNCGGEIRFVAAIVDAQTVVLNAAFVKTPLAGAAAGKTATYKPASELPGVSVFDYWSPTTSVQRILTGAAVDRMRLSVNGDFHTFAFSGPAGDLLDSASFATGQGGLTSYPTEPAITEFNYALVPGNLGQAWFGVAPDQFFTVTSAEIILDNDVDLRSREFGATMPRCIVAGVRRVTADFRVFVETASSTQALYQSARQRSPVSAFLQMGQQSGQLCGVYLKSVVPEVPEFDDSETRLEWRFRGCRAQGAIDDEIFVAFG